MDHLSAPQGADCPHIEVSYLCGDGLDVSKIMAKNEGMKEPDGSHGQDARQIQEWLWSGMLWTFLKARNVDLVDRDFVRQNVYGKDVITTARLPDYLRRWVEIYKQYSEEERTKCCRVIEK